MKKNKWLPISAISLALAGGTLLLTGCKEESAGPGQMPPTAVEIIEAKAESIDITTELPARTSAFKTAEIRPQVSGTILERIYTEGSDVKQGDSLYLIDPAPYEATYRNAKADEEVKRLGFNRYKSLLKSKSISKDEYDRAEAALKQAQATLDNAKINLEYTKVYSPISGTIGRSSVTAGALVTSQQATPLAYVQQLDPINVDMTQSVNEYMNYESMVKNNILTRVPGKVAIELYFENGQKYPLPGTIEFSDKKVNETTGSITLRAQFPNPDKLILSGMFVRAKIYEGTQNNIFLIPQKAVARDSKGNTNVKLMNAENKVEVRPITVTEAIGSNWIVTEGLKEGDKIIVTGLMKIYPGSSVVDKATLPTPKEKTAEGAVEKTQ